MNQDEMMAKFDIEQQERERILRMVLTKKINIIRSFVGKSITQIYSLNGTDVNKIVNMYRSMYPNDRYDLCDAFSSYADGLAIAFSDGTCLLFSMHEEIGSVLVRTGAERGILNMKRWKSVIPTSDPIYATKEWGDLLGKTVSGFSVIYVKRVHRRRAKPFEFGVAIHLTDGTEFMYGDCLHKVNSNPSVLFEKDMVDREELIIKRLV